ncbi:hypothetical protein LR48_Vigan05g034500 [Vigna angularis]|uniref:Uncharacterized protein n=1 Tax=Phaseolus angularis TaxID=3914 RepID=A0A0L9UJ71_PHAAN|nr:hypothetical protein LR48_Vigan05g034500 [Vigna angularis]
MRLRRPSTWLTTFRESYDAPIIPILKPKRAKEKIKATCSILAFSMQSDSLSEKVLVLTEENGEEEEEDYTSFSVVIVGEREDTA